MDFQTTCLRAVLGVLIVLFQITRPAQAQQAGNELLGLNVKQQLQLQTLIATEQRAHGLERARTLASEEEARLRFKSFVGDGEAYTK